MKVEVVGRWVGIPFLSEDETARSLLHTLAAASVTVRFYIHYPLTIAPISFLLSMTPSFDDFFDDSFGGILVRSFVRSFIGSTVADADSRYAVGPVYLAHVVDWRGLAEAWWAAMPKVHEQYPQLLAEMYALTMATANLTLPWSLVSHFMVSDPKTMSPTEVSQVSQSVSQWVSERVSEW